MLRVLDSNTGSTQRVLLAKFSHEIIAIFEAGVSRSLTRVLLAQYVR